MISSEVQLFGVSFDVPFGKALALFDAHLSDFTARLSDAALGFGLRPEQVRLRHSDILYGYELTASFFGGNAVLLRTAEQVRLTLSGGKTAPDLQVIIETLERFCKVLDLPTDMAGSVWAHAHSGFATAEAAQEYFSRFKPTVEEGLAPLELRGGAIGLMRLPQWPHEVRIAIEPSALFRDGAFVSFNTTLLLHQGEAVSLQVLAQALAAASRVYGLDLTLSS